MKRHCFILILLLSITIVINAQSKNEYGYLSGVNFSSVQKNKANNFLKETLTNYAGFNIGAYFKYNFTKSFGLKLLAQFDENGYKLTNITLGDANGNIVQASITINNRYINVPILAEFSQEKKVRYYINTGPFMGVLLRSNIVKRTFAINNSEPTKHKEKSDSFKDFNVGISLGAGALVPIGKKIQFQLGIKENIGLYNTVKVIPTDDSPFNTKAFSILIGFNIGL